jgi:hypothetical protein
MGRTKAGLLIELKADFSKIGTIPRGMLQFNTITILSNEGLKYLQSDTLSSYFL